MRDSTSCLRVMLDHGRGLLWGAALVAALGSLWTVAWANSLDSTAKGCDTPDTSAVSAAAAVDVAPAAGNGPPASCDRP